MPILKNVPVTRMPSLNLLSVKLNSQEVEPIVKTGIDCEKGYYILNPSGDLMESQSYFQTQFEKQTNWKGITGRPPSPTEYISALRDYDLFIYCGHGTGRKYIEGNAIGKIKCHATAILMGCSSGRLKRLGKQSEADGIALKYLLNGCPCVVGNLWDVTDKDIDRFTEKLIKLLVPNYSSNENLTNVAHATCIARNVCKLKYLVGAAPIVYGFPISAKK
ncbi:Separin, partial [Stegodyphus mimosarum]